MPNDPNNIVMNQVLSLAKDWNKLQIVKLDQSKIKNSIYLNIFFLTNGVAWMDGEPEINLEDLSGDSIEIIRKYFDEFCLAFNPSYDVGHYGRNTRDSSENFANSRKMKIQR